MAASKRAELRDREVRGQGVRFGVQSGEYHFAWVAAEASYKKQRKNEYFETEFAEIPDRGHSLTIDDGWHEIADVSLDFIRRFVR